MVKRLPQLGSVFQAQRCAALKTGYNSAVHSGAIGLLDAEFNPLWCGLGSSMTYRWTW